MGRFYTVQFNAVAVTAAQDLFELLAASGKPFWLHEIVLAQTTDFGDAAAEGLQLLFKRATGSYTSGSGGSSPAKNVHLTNDAAAGFTAEANNTTQAAAGSGVLTTFRAEAWNIQAPFQYLPVPEQRVLFLPAEAFVLSMSAPADSITLNGSAVVEEL